MHKSNRVTMNMLSLYLAESRLAMGRRAAEDVASAIRTLLEKQVGVRMIFAAAPSQAEMLAALREQPGIDWKRVTAFHMDEYIGLSVSAPQRFALWLRQHIFDHLPFEAIHCIEPGVDPEQTAAYYGELLNEAPIDIVCCGIGSNGHLAFNDPPAILDDPLTAKVVTLDLACRQQQVDDGCFATLADVPREAYRADINWRKAHLLLCARNAEAVGRAFYGARANQRCMPGDGSSSASALHGVSRSGLSCVIGLG